MSRVSISPKAENVPIKSVLFEDIIISTNAFSTGNNSVEISKSLVNLYLGKTEVILLNQDLFFSSVVISKVVSFEKFFSIIGRISLDNIFECIFFLL